MLKTFVGVILLGVVLSFHDTLWPWAVLLLAIAGGMLAVGLMIERNSKA
jgi:uncharacterized membrane protein YccC